MNVAATKRPVIKESMRIGGKKVDAEGVVPVHYPYTNEVIGTVPAGTAEHAARAFEIARNYKPKLTRYERQQILFRTAELIKSRKDQLSDLITLELGLSKKDSLYEVGRAYDVYSLAGQLCILDDGQIFSCDLTPQGKPRKIFTKREPVGVISAITPFNHPLNMVAHKLAPAFATNNCVVLKPTELTPLTALFLADTLYEAGLPPEMLSVITGNPSDIGDAMIVDPRAGHGPGIGGFKADSEIGMAMHAGHPCYFVGFTPEPMPGQTIEDIMHALTETNHGSPVPSPPSTHTDTQPDAHPPQT